MKRQFRKSSNNFLSEAPELNQETVFNRFNAVNDNAIGFFSGASLGGAGGWERGIAPQGDTPRGPPNGAPECNMTTGI